MKAGLKSKQNDLYGVRLSCHVRWIHFICHDYFVCFVVLSSLLSKGMLLLSVAVFGQPKKPYGRSDHL